MISSPQIFYRLVNAKFVCQIDNRIQTCSLCSWRFENGYWKDSCTMLSCHSRYRFWNYFFSSLKMRSILLSWTVIFDCFNMENNLDSLLSLSLSLSNAMLCFRNLQKNETVLSGITLRLGKKWREKNCCSSQGPPNIVFFKFRENIEQHTRRLNKSDNIIMI